ncbi:MAG: site-2 protease family protein [Patescibacteria group bacterium]
MDQIIVKLFLYLTIVVSAVFHEYAHGFAAYRLGDSTAKNEGRLTLNPLAHLDPIGTVILPLFLLLSSGMFIGWAKPVPYNPHNLRDKKYGDLKVAIVGPLTNLAIAIVLGLILRFFEFFTFYAGQPIFLEFIGLIVYINIFLALFNLIPFPPLDGSKVIMNLFPKFWRYFEQIGFLGIFIALFFAFFFISPIAQFIFKVVVGHSFGF